MRGRASNSLSQRQELHHSTNPLVQRDHIEPARQSSSLANASRDGTLQRDACGSLRQRSVAFLPINDGLP